MHAELLRKDACRPFSPFASPFLAFETDSYSVFFKPAGMHSVPAFSNDSRESLLSWVRERYPVLESSYGSLDSEGFGPSYSDAMRSSQARFDAARSRARRELGMLSRLDRETSGLVAFARSPEVFLHALGEQDSGRSRKRYWLLSTQALQEEGLEGSKPQRLSWDEGDPVLAGREFMVESYFRSYGPKGQRVACIASNQEPGKHKKISPGMYCSVFRPIPEAERCLHGAWPSVPDCLAWEASMSAGFRHQLRAHMAWCGHPIAGDRLYGLSGERQKAELRDGSEEGQGAPQKSAARLFLECRRLELSNPFETQIFDLSGEKNP